MNCVLLEPADLKPGGRAELHGRRARHLHDVRLASAGQVIPVGLIGGRLGRAVVGSSRAEEVVLESIELDTEPPPALPVTLCVALPRPKSLRRVVHAATTLGVKRMLILESWRVDKSYWQSPLLVPEALRSTLILGLEQSVDTVLPTVDVRRRFRPFVEDEVPTLVEGTRAIVAHPDGAEPMPSETSGPVTLFVGPDRGFTPFEIERLSAAGVQPCRLGRRVLRVDEAVPALLGRLLPR